MGIKIFAGFFYFLLITESSAQNNEIFRQGWGISAHVQAGKIIKHTSNFKPAIPLLSSGLEINLLKQTDGRKFWHALHHYPEMGIAFSFTEFGDEKIFGSAIGICPGIYFPFRMKENFMLQFRFGLGIAYLNRPYDVLENPGNNVIGSRVNNITSLSLLANWTLSSTVDLIPSVSFTHFSNGHFRSPNLGINFASFNLGIKYFPKPVTKFTATDSFPPLNRRLKLGWKAGFGFSDRSIPNGPLYPIYTSSLSVSKMLSLKNNLVCGVEWEYNKGVYDAEVLFENFKGRQRWVAMRLAPFIADELLFGQITLVGMVGVYVHNEFGKIAPFYFKIGGRHFFFNFYKNRFSWYYGVFLKSHYAQAEFFEFATGISF